MKNSGNFGRRPSWSRITAKAGVLLGCLCILGLEFRSAGAESDEKIKSRSGIPFDEAAPSSSVGAPTPTNAGQGSARSGALHSLQAAAKGLGISDVPGPGGHNTVDDVSRLDPTPVDSVRLPRTEDDIRQALAYARARHLGVSMAGARHSEGGQIVYDNNVVLDMNLFNKISVDKDAKMLTVQSGARWQDVLRVLDGQGLSLDVIQTHVKFSVGGSLSVNCHGSNPDSAPLASTVQSFRIMLADGSVVNASRDENPELFHAAIGGYGLVGVILDVKIQLRDNETYRVESAMVDVQDYPQYFARNIQNNPRVKYVHALLSTAPSSFLKKVSVMMYVQDPNGTEPPPMYGKKVENLEAVLFNKMFPLATSKWGQEFFWYFAGKLAPKLAGFMKFSRNQAMTEPLIAFHSNDPQETQILNEYFLPPDRFPAFVDRLRETVLKYKMTLTMAAARGVAPDKDAMLPYAPDQRLGLVLFFNQHISQGDNATMAAMTRELIQDAIDLGGRFYLPYQLVYSQEQLREAYPNIDQFFEVKRKYDPNGLFLNKWYAKYGMAQP